VTTHDVMRTAKTSGPNIKEAWGSVMPLACLSAQVPTRTSWLLAATPERATR
jgi:hypothetical protein